MTGTVYTSGGRITKIYQVMVIDFINGIWYAEKQGRHFDCVKRKHPYKKTLVYWVANTAIWIYPTNCELISTTYIQ